MRNRINTRKEEFQLSLLFLFFVLIAVGGIFIYRSSIIDNSILEYEVLSHYKNSGRTTSSVMEIKYNGIIKDISISKDSFESLDRGIIPLVFYNSEFDAPFNFLHIILFTKFLGGIFIIAGFVGVIFLLIDWRVKSKMKKVFMISSVLLCGLMGSYFISFESKKIQTRTFAFSSENATTLFSSFEEDSIVHWKKNILPATYQYEGMYQSVHYPDFFLGDRTFLAEIIDKNENNSTGPKRIFYGSISAFVGNKTIELDPKQIVDISIIDDSVQRRTRCSGGFFCVELPVSKSVDILFNLEGYKTKQVRLFFSDSTNINLVTANCIFNEGEGFEKVLLDF